MRKYTLAVVCVLGLTAGAAAGLALYRQPQGAAGARGVVEKRTDVAREAALETGAVADKGAAAAYAGDVEPWGAGGDSAFSAGDVRDETGGAGIEGRDNVRDEVGMTSENSGKTASVIRRRAGSNGSDIEGSRAVRGHVRVSSREGNNGGPGVAGHAFRGVKKTGQVISKPFRKLGGVFHD